MAKKKFIIEWELIQKGTSEVLAEDIDEAKDMAYKCTVDFSDPNQFTPTYDDYSVWEVKSIIEKGGNMI